MRLNKTKELLPDTLEIHKQMAQNIVIKRLKNITKEL